MAKPFLPPATVVAGRQCFYRHVSFLLSTGRGVSWHEMGQGGVYIPACNGVGVSARGVSARGCLPGGVSDWGCLPPPAPEMVTKAGGTHPTGMHSC